jgi:hypothetical protein
MQPQQLVHQASNPDGTCSIPDCPCHEWSQRERALASIKAYHDEAEVERRRAPAPFPFPLQHPPLRSLPEANESPDYYRGYVDGRAVGKREAYEEFNGDLRELVRVAGERLR